MASILYKWLLILLVGGLSGGHHPIFVSVTEIEHNSKEQTLEISCKLFTDDFETTLRKTSRTKVDLLDPQNKAAMHGLVKEYVLRHFKLAANGKPVGLNYLGFEQHEEGIVSYFEASGIASVKQLQITNDLLYDFQPQQMGIVHVTVNGTRKSSRLNNPDSKVEFNF